MTVTVYSKDACVQCDATIRSLNKNGIDYVVVDVASDTEALEKLRAMGYMQAPVVHVSDDEHWGGFRPDRIKGLVKTSA